VSTARDDSSSLSLDERLHADGTVVLFNSRILVLLACASVKDPESNEMGTHLLLSTNALDGLLESDLAHVLDKPLPHATQESQGSVDLVLASLGVLLLDGESVESIGDEARVELEAEDVSDMHAGKGGIGTHAELTETEEENQDVGVVLEDRSSLEVLVERRLGTLLDECIY
jgi:hypothetical protein